MAKESKDKESLANGQEVCAPQLAVQVDARAQSKAGYCHISIPTACSKKVTNKTITVEDGDENDTPDDAKKCFEPRKLPTWRLRGAASG